MGHIQDLIDAASPGDTVHLPFGTYGESISIDKPLTLIGHGSIFEPGASIRAGALAEPDPTLPKKDLPESEPDPDPTADEPQEEN